MKTRILSIVLALAVTFTSSVTATAQTTDCEVITRTMSVEEFTDVAEEYGFTVMYEEDYHPKARISENFTVEFSNNYIQRVGLDNNLLNETARVKVITLSANVTSVDVKFIDNHTNEIEYSRNLTEGDWSSTFDVAALNGYSVWVQAYGPALFSSSNVGRVTIYWTDDESDWS